MITAHTTDGVVASPLTDEKAMTGNCRQIRLNASRKAL